jgi:hypothetical protein
MRRLQEREWYTTTDEFRNLKAQLSGDFYEMLPAWILDSFIAWFRRLPTHSDVRNLEQAHADEAVTAYLKYRHGIEEVAHRDTPPPTSFACLSSCLVFGVFACLRSCLIVGADVPLLPCFLSRLFAQAAMPASMVRDNVALAREPRPIACQSYVMLT